MSLLRVGKKLVGIAEKQIRLRSAMHHCIVCSQQIMKAKPLSSFRQLTTAVIDTDELSTSSSDPQSKGKRGDEKRSKAGGSGKFQKKLHSRVFSEEEHLENKKYSQSLPADLMEGDSFGTLLRKERKKLSVASPTLYKTESSSAERKQRLKTPRAERQQNLSDLEFVADNATSRFSSKIFHSRKQKGAQPERRDGWTDTFGTLQEDDLEDRIQESLHTEVGSHEERFSDDEDEDLDRKHIRLSAVNRRRIPEWYGRRILKLGKRGQVRDAIKVFEEWMLKQDRVMPNAYVFTCLITVLGRAGYTHKAFSLFNKMKEMGVTPNPVTYTALFNACANSPWKEDGRARADNLYRLMIKKEVKPTFITGKAMIKAFAVCGDLRRAFALLDTLSQVYRPDQQVFSFLLMACISDKEAGLQHAIQVWRLMQQMGVRPDLPLYNLLIRCVRDCGVGQTTTFTSLLAGDRGSAGQNSRDGVRSLQGASSPISRSTLDARVLTLDLGQREKESSVDGRQDSFESDSCSEKWEAPSTSTEEVHSSSKVRSDNIDSYDEIYGVTKTGLPKETHTTSSSAITLHSAPAIPDVLSPASDVSGLVSLGDLSSKEQRLLLLGGVEGVLGRMTKDGAVPDIITFTQLISVAMPTVEAEEQLLEKMKGMKVKPDIDLVNALIHKRCMRGDFAAARATGDLLMEYGLTANQKTYGVQAMACKTIKDASRLLGDMETADLAPNVEILGTLMYAAGMNFGHKLWVLRQMQKLDLQPNDKFLRNIESGLVYARRRMVDAEKRGERDSYFLAPKFQESLETFVHHYESWLRKTRLQVSPHPWAPFKPVQAGNKDNLST